MAEAGDPPVGESTPEQDEIRARIAEVDAQLAAIKGTFAPKEKMHGLRLKQFQSMAMKKGVLRLKLMGGRKKQPDIRLVKAVAAERVATKAIGRVAEMVADTTESLRLGINRYGTIARRELADYLLDKLQNGTAEEQALAADKLLDLFTRMVDIHGDLKTRSAKRVARPGWPSEGSKG